MAAAEIATLREMPLDEKWKVFYCRTGNYVLFQLFHLRHRLPGSAARIIAQNFASCRLACSFKVTFFLVFNPLTSLLPQLAWVEMGCGT
jgi:RNase P subunit RPR2